MASGPVHVMNSGISNFSLFSIQTCFRLLSPIWNFRNFELFIVSPESLNCNSTLNFRFLSWQNPQRVFLPNFNPWYFLTRSHICLEPNSFCNNFMPEDIPNQFLFECFRNVFLSAQHTIHPYPPSPPPLPPYPILPESLHSFHPFPKYPNLKLLFKIACSRLNSNSCDKSNIPMRY